jgi:DNA-binding transcriptional regulator YhcF (GntR family)
MSGVLPAGHRLPSVCQLASDLGLANGTVARAYRELESADLVTTAGRNGTVVTSTGMITTAARQSRLRDAADAFVRVTRQLGAADQETSPHWPGPASDHARQRALSVLLRRFGRVLPST